MITRTIVTTIASLIKTTKVEEACEECIASVASSSCLDRVAGDIFHCCVCYGSSSMKVFLNAHLQNYLHGYVYIYRCMS